MTTTSTAGLDLPDLSKCSVLVVEDNIDARDIFSTMLRFCGARVFDTDTASGARACLSVVHANIIVLDMRLPGESGAEFLSWLRRQPPEHGGNTTAVLITAYPADYPALAIKGHAAYHQKPVRPEVLCRTIGDLLRRNPPPAQGRRV